MLKDILLGIRCNLDYLWMRIKWRVEDITYAIKRRRY
jgi:hypothetical protein